MREAVADLDPFALEGDRWIYNRQKTHNLRADYALADIYAERDWGRINEANRRVLDLFSWGAGEP